MGVPGINGVDGGVSFVKKDDPTVYLSREGDVVVPKKIDPDNDEEEILDNATWCVKPGLSNPTDPSAISVMVPNTPGVFIRHDGGEIKTHPDDETQSYPEDATWNTDAEPSPCAYSTTNDCDSDAACHPTDNSFTCVCKEGFFGDGKVCSIEEAKEKLNKEIVFESFNRNTRFIQPRSHNLR